MQLGLYAQDTWKVSSRLTLNLGLRWDLLFPWREIKLDSPAVVFDANYHSTRFPTAPPGLAFPGDPGIPKGIMFMDMGDFAPRLGFSYDVFGDGRTAIRGGYGILYNAPGAITLANCIEARLSSRSSCLPQILSSIRTAGPGTPIHSLILTSTPARTHC